MNNSFPTRRLSDLNKDWARVEEFVPWDTDNSIDLGRATEPPSREMRRQLARLGLGLDPHSHQAAGDEIVTDDLIRLVVDIKAGKSGEDRKSTRLNSSH